MRWMPSATSRASELRVSDTSRLSTSYARKRNLCLFLIIAMDWFAIDFYTKSWVNDFQPGDVLGGPFFGLFDFRLVHNTGGAFGTFEGSSLVLGGISLAVCLVVLIYLFKIGPRSSIPMVIGLSLVFAGGLGNAVDRFTLGYVVDFIETTFISFPVFNVADIGVTCGLAIVFLTFLLEGKREADERLLAQAEQMGAPKVSDPVAERAEAGPGAEPIRGHCEPHPTKPGRRVITPPELEDEDVAS